MCELRVKNNPSYQNWLVEITMGIDGLKVMILTFLVSYKVGQL